MNLIPIEGHEGLYKDSNTGAVLNNNQNDYQAYIKNRDRLISNKSRLNDLESKVDDLKNDISDIKSILLNLNSKKD